MKENEHEKTMLTCIMYSILFMNDLFTSWIFDMLCMLKSSRYYGQKMKFRVKNLEKQVKMYNGFINKTRYAGFIADINDSFQEKIKTDMTVAEQTVINYMKGRGVPEPVLMGMMVVCDVLGVEACRTVDDNIKIHSAEFPDVRRFKSLHVKKIAESLLCLSHEFEDTMWRIRHYDADIRKSEEIKSAFSIIRNKLNDPGFILDVIEAYDSIEN